MPNAATVGRLALTASRRVTRCEPHPALLRHVERRLDLVPDGVRVGLGKCTELRADCLQTLALDAHEGRLE